MAEPDRELLRAAANAGLAELGLALAPATVERLLDYLTLLQKWNAVYNLTAVRDPQQMLVQHLLDCLAAMPAFAQAKRVLDVGSGGGLPGLVLAIWAAERVPSLQVHLIDTVHKKTAFLTQVKAELGLSQVTVHTGRVEQLSVDERFDVITSRAFAQLSDFVHWAGHLLADGGQMIAMKAQLDTAELGAVPAGWHVARVAPLRVPGLDAQRHLIHVQRAPNT